MFVFTLFIKWILSDWLPLNESWLSILITFGKSNMGYLSEVGLIDKNNLNTV